jgi:hypothetical protein
MLYNKHQYTLAGPETSLYEHSRRLSGMICTIFSTQ